MLSGDDATWVGAYAGVAAALLTAVSAGGVVWGARIARSAAGTWRGVHEHAKADECIAAAFDLAHAVNRFVDERIRVNDLLTVPTEPFPFPGEIYDAAWAAWRRFQTAHVIAFRYHVAHMSRQTPDRLARTLEALSTWSYSLPRDFSRTGMAFDRASLDAAKAEGNGIKDRTWKEAEAIDTALAPPRDRSGQALPYIGRPGRSAWWLPKL